MIANPTDDTLEEITLELTTEVIMEEGDTEVN